MFARVKALFTCAVIAMSAVPAVADGPVVVELFTSQGCSSCPPADALLGELAARDDVLALSLHVDYWDYLGWKDEFADPAHTQRQRGYARAAGSTMIYTPQMVIGGVDHIVGTKAMKLVDTIMAHKGRARPIVITTKRVGDTVQIVARQVTVVNAPMIVQLVRYTPAATVPVKRGENTGKTLTYHNIVRSWSLVAEWDGQSEISLTVEVPGEDKAAILVQDQNAGPILAAAKID